MHESGERLDSGPVPGRRPEQPENLLLRLRNLYLVAQMLHHGVRETVVGAGPEQYCPAFPDHAHYI